MKVFIGPYRRWIGPYQLADCLKYVGVSEDRRDKIGEWLADTKVLGLCERIYRSRKRNWSVKIHNYDTWGMDSTLAIIILPLLKQLNVTKHGAPFVDDIDAPEHLRSTAAPPKDNEWDTDDLHFERWQWMMNEMIWAFEQLQPGCDWEDKYHTGTVEIEWVKSDSTWPNPDTGKQEETFELKKGLKDTSNFDKEGYKAHADRIDNGCRLFGTYFRSLWD